VRCVRPADIEERPVFRIRFCCREKQVAIARVDRTRLTANGRLVSAFVSRIWARPTSGGLQLRASVPRPPALLTAAANSGDVAPPIAAWTIGMSIPTSAQKAFGIHKTKVSVMYPPSASDRSVCQSSDIRTLVSSMAQHSHTPRIRRRPI
jgi:hypothetical protein